MTWRYATLSLILVTCVYLRELVTALTSSAAPRARLHSSFTDPESILATNGKLPLACAGVWSLELISGVSDRLAEELLRQRETILTAAQSMSPEQALQKAKGVGEVMSKKLARYISLQPECSGDDPYQPLAPHRQ